MPDDTPRRPPPGAPPTDLPGMEPSARDGEFDTGFPVDVRRRPDLDVYGVEPGGGVEPEEEREPRVERAEGPRSAPAAKPAESGESDPDTPSEQPAPRRGSRGSGPPKRRPLFAREGEPERVPASERAPEREPDPAEQASSERWEGDEAAVEEVEPAAREGRLPAPPPRTPPPPEPAHNFRRADVYAHPVERGREVSDTPWRRSWLWLRDVLTPRAQKEEEALDAQLRALRRVTRTNLIACLSPKGGVGKTTCTFLIGNLVASHCKLRTLIVDANPQWGTLAALAPDEVRSDLSLSDLLANLDDVDSAPELQPYISPLPTGCHLLGAPTDPAVMARMGPDEYTRLLKFLSRYYEAILLDLGTGVVDPLAQTAIRAADQGLLVTTPEYVTTEKVIGVVGYLGTSRDPNLGEDAAAPPEQVLTVVLNKAPREGSGDRQQIEAAFRRQQVGKSVIVPHDDRLRVMLDSATYTLDDLPRKTRMPIKRLGLAVAQDLV